MNTPERSKAESGMRGEGRWHFVADAVQDAGYAIRKLLRAPGFATIVVLTLAVGIGATSAVFTVVNGVLLRPLPYDAPEELVSVTTAFPTQGFERFWLSPPEYYELQEWNEAFDEVGAWRVGTRSIETDDRPMQVTSSLATWSLFPTLGVEAAIGRTFTREEDLPGADPVVLLSHGLWERGFGSDPAIIGRSVRSGGSAATVVGVLPEGFDMEDAGVDLWVPLNPAQNVDPGDHVERRGNHFMNVVARLADGVSIERARADLDRLEARWTEEYGSSHAINGQLHPIRISDFRADLLGDVQPALFLLLGAVGFVLLIACANVGSLLLARSEGRGREVAVRVAMGAGRGRLGRQLLVEGVTLAALGGLAGLFLGQLALDTLLQVNPDGVPRVEEVALDGSVLLFTALVTLGTGVLFGLAPLVSTTMARVGSTLKEGGARSTGGASASRARRVLVVAEVALAVVLLTGSGLMLRSLDALRNVDPGFRTESLLTFQLDLPASDYPAAEDVGGFFTTLLERLRELPGVTAASATSGLPPVRTLNANDTEFEGVPRTSDGPPHNVDYYTAIESGYLEAMDISLAEGRAFEPRDGLAETPVILVNRRLARTFYGDRSPLGRRMRPSGSSSWYTVLGVVEDVKQAGVAGEVGTEIYFFHPQLVQSGLASFPNQFVVVRTETDPVALAPAATRIVSEIDPSLAVSDVESMEQHLDRTLAEPRFLTLLLAAFGGIALLLAAVGIYGVMSYSVAERNREIGIRMAVGAESGDVLRLVVRQGGVLTLTGVVLGVLGSFALTRFLSAQLFEVEPTDPGVFLAASLFLGIVALVGCYIPARRATRVDPVTALAIE